MLGPELPEWSVKVFATDLDERPIAFARRGLYPANVLRNLPATSTATATSSRRTAGYRISKACGRW